MISHKIWVTKESVISTLWGRKKESKSYSSININLVLFYEIYHPVGPLAAPAPPAPRPPAGRRLHKVYKIDFKRQEKQCAQKLECKNINIWKILSNRDEICRAIIEHTPHRERAKYVKTIWYQWIKNTESENTTKYIYIELEKRCRKMNLELKMCFTNSHQEIKRSDSKTSAYVLFANQLTT